MPRKRTPEELGYHPDWCQKTLDLMREGQGFNSVCSELKISRKTLDKVAERQPEFGEALAIGLAAYHAWWEEQGRQNLNNKLFRDVLWIFNMKNRCLWRDSVDQRRDINVTVKTESIEQTNALIKSALKKDAVNPATKH